MALRSKQPEQVPPALISDPSSSASLPLSITDPPVFISPVSTLKRANSVMSHLLSKGLTEDFKMIDWGITKCFTSLKDKMKTLVDRASNEIKELVEESKCLASLSKNYSAFIPSLSFILEIYEKAHKCYDSSDEKSVPPVYSPYCRSSPSIGVTKCKRVERACPYQALDGTVENSKCSNKRPI
ncbi:hypothetical protein K501DRAFT_271773 [Backusella circina FSU 941]|nr:hypothetical protein K501DRAFT_271773 [Backusella circina FSU 941]